MKNKTCQLVEKNGGKAVALEGFIYKWYIPFVPSTTSTNHHILSLEAFFKPVPEKTDPTTAHGVQ